MSLATRCTSCGTAFRVVQDQLKVSEGWVRCGRCSEVFNALEGLFDLEREAPPEWQRPSLDSPAEGVDATDAAPAIAHADDLHDRPDVAAGAATDTADDLVPAPERHRWRAGTRRESEDSTLPRTAIEGTPTGAPDPDGATDEWAGAAYEREASLEEQIDAHLFGARSAARRRAPAAHVSERDKLDFSDARFDSDLLADDPAGAEMPDPARFTRPDELALEVPTPPEFLRRAESRARWQRPIVRAALAGAALLSLAGLTLQAGHHFRDLAAARWPALRPAFAQWCAMAACTLGPPRRIEDISVESTALAKAPGTEAFRLAVTLRSHGSMPVALPWIDLSLTDASGKLVARKALATREFNPAATALAPGAEIVLQTLLATRGARVTGYTVEIFYP
ncbi:MAG TPA: zinc-ribbon and DUF3426 domain-containing protein [Caldimonas sp.]